MSPRLHAALELTRVGPHGLLFRWPGHGDERPVVLMAHLDVVPADNYAGCIRLTPRNEALAKYIQRVEIYVEKAPDYRVTRVIIRESEVDLTDMRFRQDLRNPSIPEGRQRSVEE